MAHGSNAPLLGFGTAQFDGLADQMPAAMAFDHAATVAARLLSTLERSSA